MNELKTSSDYGFIAFLSTVKHIEFDPINTKKIRRGKMEYGFLISDADWIKLRLEYSQSIYPKFLQQIKLLQDPSF